MGSTAEEILHRANPGVTMGESAIAAAHDIDQEPSPAEITARMERLTALVGVQTLKRNPVACALSEQHAQRRTFDLAACLGEMVQALAEAQEQSLGELLLLHALVMVKPGNTLAMAVTIALSERDQLRRMTAVEPMTQQQVDVLSEGASVWVKWSGGNGPHRYTVTVDKYNVRWAAESGDALDRVGRHPQTQVWPAVLEVSSQWLREPGRVERG